MKTAAAILLLAATALAYGQGDRSLTDSGNLLVAQQGASRGVPPPPTLSSGAPETQEHMLLLRNSVKNLTESLALANSENETLKRDNEDLRLRLEAVGGVKSDSDQRMVEALRDLRASKQKEESVRNQLIRLAEVTQILLAAITKDIDADIRTNAEAELRRTNEELGDPDAPEPQAVEAAIDNAMVVEVKDELSLVVLNVGERHEVQIGMPFQIWRGTTRVATVRVVDVRDRISGAIIQNLNNDFVKIKKGDRAKVDARK